jgi:hypothetical protein
MRGAPQANFPSLSNRAVGPERGDQFIAGLFSGDFRPDSWLTSTLSRQRSGGQLTLSC